MVDLQLVAVADLLVVIEYLPLSMVCSSEFEWIASVGVGTGPHTWYPRDSHRVPCLCWEATKVSISPSGNLNAPCWVTEVVPVVRMVMVILSQWDSSKEPTSHWETLWDSTWRGGSATMSGSVASHRLPHQSPSGNKHHIKD